MLFYYLIPILVIIRVYDHYRINNMALATEYKLVTLRTVLKKECAEGKIDAERETAKVVGHLIDSTIADLKTINLWFLIYCSLKNRKDEKPDIVTALEDEIKANASLKEVVNNLAGITTGYLYKKSLLVTLLRLIRVCYNHCKRWFSNRNDNNSINNIRSRVKQSLIKYELASIPTC